MMYESIMKKVPMGDWSAFKQRVDAAEELAKKAFCDRDKNAWDLVQIILWRLTRRNHYHFKEADDLLVLKTIYKVEESQLPEPILSPHLTSEQFLQKLVDEAEQYAGEKTLMGKTIKNSVLSMSDWRYVGYQWLCSAIDFSRHIAVASLNLPLKEACVLYENLYDESGEGKWENAHFVQLSNLFGKLGIDVNDEDTLLRWVVPEVIAHVNTLTRLLMHPDPCSSLGALFIVEKLMPGDSVLVGQAMLRSNRDIPVEKYFHTHTEIDVKHASQWLEVIAQVAKTPEQRKTTYQAMTELGRAQKAAWDASYEGWQRWKEAALPVSC